MPVRRPPPDPERRTGRDALTAGTEWFFVPDPVVTTTVPGKNELPTVLQSDHNTYLAGALPLCVILADEAMRPWFYSQYIQLYAMGSDSQQKAPHLDFHSSLTCREVLHTRTLDRAAAGRIGRIVAFLRSCIDSGRHVIVFVDDSFLRGEPRPFVHELLVHGYDDRSEQLRVVGFGGAIGRPGSQRFQTLEFGYQAFEEAFERALSLTAPDSDFAAIRYPVQLLQRVRTRPAFDPGRLWTELSSYLEAPELDIFRAGTEYWWWSPPKPEAQPPDFTVSSGFEVHDRFTHHLKAVEAGDHLIDYRQFHLLWEHKTAILRRLEHLAREFDLQGGLDDVISGCRRRAQEFLDLRLKVLMALNGRSTPRAMAQGVSLVTRTLHEEPEALSRVRDVVAGLR
ncbi:hypothetical protein ACFVHI_17345 [Kitasatospora sp. NPDC127121]|uniref:hypothetical protein n=1 Tax=Kitasatospora sp. NPDC127121 TaxID=3345371 RepID=UPI00363EB4FD